MEECVMLDLNALYSYRGQEPQLLPHEILLSDGRSRTDNTSFTLEEIVDAGFTGPYNRPDYDDQTHNLVWNSVTLEYSIEEKVVYDPEAGFSQEQLWDIFRAERNFRLEKSDWSMLQDAPISEQKKEEWSNYRQQLRDLPSKIETISSMRDINWPIIP